MARRGSFGRSGTSQNLTTLVYQIMKQQMADELEAILAAYNTNMKAGMYEAQFNGQNVDGEYVLDYYRNLLAGFPPGSSEYETINSKLQAFEQSYQQDVQDLVIQSMNNGSKVDFGLLGSGFSNKGISEVTLSDVRGWSQQQIAQLEADGDFTQADKLKGAVYVAGFNVENDGKVAAVTRGDMSYAAYNNWLKGQLEDTLDNGLTEDSEAYRGILKLQAQAQKDAKTDGQNKADESYKKTISDTMKPVYELANDILNSYITRGGVHSTEVATAIAESGGDSLKAIQFLAAQQGENSAYTGIYADIFGFGSDLALEQDFANKLLSAQDKLRLMQTNGYGGTDSARAEALDKAVNGIINANVAFISNSGVAFSAGGGKTAMDQFYQDIKGAGVTAFQDKAVQENYGGMPQGVMAAFGDLGAAMKKIGNTDGFSWLQEIANGNLPVGLLDGAGREAFKDLNNDGFVSQSEFDVALSDVSIRGNKKLLSDTVAAIAANAGAMNLPTSDFSANITTQSVAQLFIDAQINKAILKAGGTAIIETTGDISFFEGSNAAGAEGAPTIFQSGGEQVFAMAKPLYLTVPNASGDRSTFDDLGGKSVAIYRTGGSNGDAYVRISGQFTGIGGQAANGFSLPLKVFKQWALTAGIELNDTTYFNRTQDGQSYIDVDNTNGKDDTYNDRWNQMFNPASELFIGKVVPGSGITEQNLMTNYQFNGFNGSPEQFNQLANDVLKNGPDAIMKRAQEMVGTSRPITMDDINKATFSLIPGVPSSFNIDIITVPKFGQSPQIASQLSKWFPDQAKLLQAQSSLSPVSNYAAGQAGMTKDQLITNTYLNQGGTPTSTAPNAPYVSSYGAQFLNQAFAKKPAMAPPPKPVVAPGIKPTTTPVVKPTTTPGVKPTTTPGVKPTTTPPVTSYSPKTTPTKANVINPSTPGVNTGYTRGVN